MFPDRRSLAASPLTAGRRVKALVAPPTKCPAVGCGVMFDRRIAHQIYCSHRCRTRGWLARVIEAAVQARINGEREADGGLFTLTRERFERLKALHRDPRA